MEKKIEKTEIELEGMEIRAVKENDVIKGIIGEK